MMTPKKPHLYFDLDNGRPSVQQSDPGNDTYYSEYSLSNSNSPQSATFFSHASDLETRSDVSGNPTFWKTSSSSSWDVSNDMQSRDYRECGPYAELPLSMCMKNEEMVNLDMYDCHRQVHLVMRTPPEHRFRYRYDTEMSGTHGSLQGIKANSEKSVPEVELINYPHEALIRVSLVTCNKTGERYPHPHNLFIKEKMYQKKVYENLHSKSLTKTGHYSDPHYISVGMNGVGYVARFEGMCIISSKKENFSASIKEKLEIRDMEQGICLAEKEDFTKKVDDAVKLVDLDFVSLCFEAFRREEGRLVPICAPLYSEPIGNAKSANTGKLKISRINKCSGSCRGGDEIWLLVEKINKKGLVIRFFEECNGDIVWESCIEGDDITLHHQYAIIFKTPPYRDPNISTEVKVLMRLERSTQLSQGCNFSEPITFVYEPPKNRNYKTDTLCKKESILSPNKQTHIKRPRTDSSAVSSLNFQFKRKRDEQDCSNMNSDDGDLEQISIDKFLDNDPSHLSQYWTGFNVEELLSFFGDDGDVTLQRDGASPMTKSRRGLVKLMQLICSKFDEQEIKKITDRLNNIKFPKTKSRVENGSSCDEKSDVEEAVSTLLSLRERAVEINTFKKEVEKDDCESSLHEAILQNKPDVVRKILKPANCVHQDEDQNTPLHLSLLLRRDSCTDSLLQFRPDSHAFINLKNKDGKTPLHIAAANGNTSHVRLLVESGADVNETETKTKRNALHIALFERNRDVAEYLIENTEIRLDAEDEDGQTPRDIPQLMLPSERIRFEKLFRPKEIKEERVVRDATHDDKNNNDLNLDKLYDALNETKSWRKLAEMWNCSYLIQCAEEAQNPAKCIFNSYKKLNEGIDVEGLRTLLDAINDKKGLVVLDEILARRFLYSK